MFRLAPETPWSNSLLRRLGSDASRRYCRNRSYSTKLDFIRSSQDHKNTIGSRIVDTYSVRGHLFAEARSDSGFRKLHEQNASYAPEKCHHLAQHFIRSLDESSASPNQVTQATLDCLRDNFEHYSFRKRQSHGASFHLWNSTFFCSTRLRSQLLVYTILLIPKVSPSRGSYKDWLVGLASYLGATRKASLLKVWLNEPSESCIFHFRPVRMTFTFILFSNCPRKCCSSLTRSSNMSTSK